MNDLENVDFSINCRELEALDWERPDGLALIHRWVMLGLAPSEIAKNMGISRNRLTQWSRNRPLIAEALQYDFSEHVPSVEAALLKRALGFEYEETKSEEGDSDKGSFRRETTTTKQVPGDVAAQKFWLTNVAPERWAERRDVKVDVTVIEQQAQQLLDVMDTAISGLGLTPDQRARLPELVRRALMQQGLVQGELMGSDDDSDD